MRISKDTLKGLLIGAIITSFVFCSIFAAPVKKSISVEFNNFKIAVDGKVIDLKDTKGTAVEPFTYNGLLYVPARPLVEAMGREISMDANTNTIYVGQIVKLNGMVIGAGDMTPFIKSKMNVGATWEQDKKLSINGVPYESRDSMICNGIGAGGSTGIIYALEGNYNKLNGFFGVDDSSPDPVGAKLSEAGACLQILGDGKVIYETPVAIKSGNPYKIDVDIIGVKQLEIKVTDNGNKKSEYRYRYDFVNVKFVKNQK